MKCEEFEHEWQELDDPSLFSPAMEDHRSVCAPCAAQVRDVNRIRWEAMQLTEAEDPPDRLWLNIRHELDREGLIREPGGRSWLAEVLAFGWLPRLPIGLAYASVFLLALVGMEYVRDRMTPASSPASLSPPTIVADRSSGPLPGTTTAPNAEQAAALPAEAPKREETLASVAAAVPPAILAKAPPEQRAILVRNWQQIHDSVDESQRFFNEHPDDPLALEQLFIMQQQQTRFVGTLTRFQE